ncbi:putative D-alanyl-D-alanine carboxypeptidase/D-alanyl-D-alanine-endopeptidase [Paratrimastix pyriformis]|uniref:D-alanyl-D-alanine carboxypeptidase/D-alanyl-D-alanine-endopeptidase n=1 Tax=Paratrimastix pyriformis TaxID=342808 RepID=A0ABQ8UPW5_9EUKA|nr:putative D-alanyl-D-alanine carboxypeptidase/D-alanyl-D-alanine-endopeptidase [Paratrimastix pyriformis]
MISLPELLDGKPVKWQEPFALGRFSFLFFVLPLLSAAICPWEIKDEIDKVLASPRASTSIIPWAVTFENVTGTQTITSSGTAPLILPASNLKYLTIISTLMDFPPDWKPYHTRVLAHPSGEANSTFDDICLRGQGDPSLTSASLRSLADALVNFTAAGHTPVRITIHTPALASASLSVGEFDTLTGGQTWAWGDLASNYAGQPTLLVVDDNLITITVCSNDTAVYLCPDSPEHPTEHPVSLAGVSITPDAPEQPDLDLRYLLDPAEGEPRGWVILGRLRPNSASNPLTYGALSPHRRAADLFRARLIASGMADIPPVMLADCGTDTPAEPEWTVVGEVESAPVLQLVNHTMQESDNLYAQSFLRLLGWSAFGDRSRGLDRVQDRMATLLGRPMQDDELSIVDGNGLSRQDVLSAHLLNEILHRVALNQTLWERLFACLPVAGQSGTLTHRFRGTPLEGRLRAKTGSLIGIFTLAGYLPTPPPDQGGVGLLSFSMLLNGWPYGGTEGRNLVDKAVGLFANLSACPGRCPQDCNGRGTCRAGGFCECNLFFEGVACERPVNPGEWLHWLVVCLVATAVVLVAVVATFIGTRWWVLRKASRGSGAAFLYRSVNGSM